jgi:four helix bundle protein
MRRTYHDLIVWQRAIRLAKEAYAMSEGFPSAERYGLSSQMRRSAVSVASNIAEGSSRGTKREFIQFLNIARGSLAELETQITIAEELGLISDAKQIRALTDEIFGLLNGLIKSMRR